MKSNIDEQGKVLFLDEERLGRKEEGLPVYRNKTNGLGIKNWLLKHVFRKEYSLDIKLEDEA